MLKEYIRKPRLNVCLFLFRAQEGVKKIPGFERLRKWSNKKVAKKKCTNANLLEENKNQWSVKFFLFYCPQTAFPLFLSALNTVLILTQWKGKIFEFFLLPQKFLLVPWRCKIADSNCNCSYIKLNLIRSEFVFQNTSMKYQNFTCPKHFYLYLFLFSVR